MRIFTKIYKSMIFIDIQCLQKTTIYHNSFFMNSSGPKVSST